VAKNKQHRLHQELITLNSREGHYYAEGKGSDGGEEQVFMNKLRKSDQLPRK